ncbi:CbtB-domain containing protein [uncultured Sphingomonas sp.]|uniref:CbtB domain-containing protein n=1 Tax=uncultured Sphingomonas sp. TaxID=158754 RepID=UPI0025F7B539|nr:CbtB-domain containing protein [uncultured Sphingomonas sp.]
MTSAVAAFDDSFIPVGATADIPLGDIAPWAVLATVMALILLYFVSTEQGAFALFDGMYVHEYVHDGRHLLGFPCH